MHLAYSVSLGQVRWGLTPRCINSFSSPMPSLLTSDLCKLVVSAMLSEFQNPNGSISRTVQYKKITKPLLERKRRARINRCLDELKELMVDALEAEGENISKLEKADILELTVRHLHRLHTPDPVSSQRFQAGFGRCAAEAYHYLINLPVAPHVTQSLARHLGAVLPLSVQVPPPRGGFSPPLSPPTPREGVVMGMNISVREMEQPVEGLLMVKKDARGVLRDVLLERKRKKLEDDMEIDIEKVDDQMWRPW